MSQGRPGGNPDIARIGAEKGNRFSSTNQPANKPGPRPSKIRAYIIENDLGSKDITNAILSLSEMNEEEIKALSENKEAPILLRGFAKAMMAEMDKSGLLNLLSLLDRAIGKPKQEIDIRTRPIMFDPSENDDEPKP